MIVTAVLVVAIATLPLHVECEANSGVPCYLHPAGDGCHYRVKPDSSLCTSPNERRHLKQGIVLVNRTLVSLEQQLIKLGVIPPDRTCPELPAVSNGGIIYSDLNLSPGTTARYICNAGFTLFSLHGRSEFTCDEDGIWDGRVADVPVECELSSDRCEEPNSVTYGHIKYRDDDSANILVGDVIEYSCDPGAELHGPSTRFCLRSGNWSDSEPECIVKENNATEPVPENRRRIEIGAGLGSTLALILFVAVVAVSFIVYRCRRKKKPDDQQPLRISDEADDNNTTHNNNC